ncbi:hypothetical protein BVY03_04455 [bacterium K02(2017)]|nr:hypothetical protein BVY03_04455 [bacterium K02(2017)]
MFLGKNGVIHILLISLTIGLSFLSLWFLFLYPSFLIMSDILYYGFHIKIFDPEERIMRGYEFGSKYIDAPYGQGLDLGFNLYDGDYTKSRNQAQKDKWDFLIQQLQLKPGMSLIDVGCGFGDWINYAKSQGINVVGINITPAQVEVNHQRGLDVICSNWKDVLDNPEYKEKLLGKFDAVTFMDTIEHYVPAQHRLDRTEQNKIYKHMYEFASRLIDDDSVSKRIFISCLHAKVKQNQSIKCLVTNYYLDKYHSGCYPVFEIDQLVVNGTDKHFKLLERWNKTIDYFKTTELDPEHFGLQKMTWNLKRFIYIFYFMLLDPDWFHKWIYRSNKNWMKQFNSKDITESPMQLLWLLFQKV